MKESDKYKNFFLDRGINLTFYPYIGTYKGKFYPDSYSENELKIFGLTEKDIIDRYHQYGKLCNTGYNVGKIEPNGDVRCCFFINKYLGNIYEGFKFKDKLVRCPLKFCSCPVNVYDPYLFKKAINEIDPYKVEYILAFKYRIEEYVKNLLFKDKHNYLLNNTRKLIIKKLMKTKFFRKYFL